MTPVSLWVRRGLEFEFELVQTLNVGSRLRADWSVRQVSIGAAFLVQCQYGAVRSSLFNYQSARRCICMTASGSSSPYKAASSLIFVPQATTPPKLNSQSQRFQLPP